MSEVIIVVEADPPPPAPPPPIVIFDYVRWMAAYPEFAAVTQPRAERFFTEATLYCDNTACSPICNMSQRELLLGMMTAHIAALNGGLNPCGVVAAGNGVGMVGRITNASEGSVSIGSEYPMTGDGPSAAWYNQTPYGAAYWAATAQFRTWRVYLGPQPFAPVYAPYGPLYGVAATGWRR